MKKIILLLTISLLIVVSCNDDTTSPDTTITQPFAPAYLIGTWTDTVYGGTYTITSTTFEQSGVPYTILSANLTEKSLFLQVDTTNTNAYWNDGDYTKMFWTNYAVVTNTTNVTMTTFYPGTNDRTVAEEFNSSAVFFWGNYLKN